VWCIVVIVLGCRCVEMVVSICVLKGGDGCKGECKKISVVWWMAV